MLQATLRGTQKVIKGLDKDMMQAEKAFKLAMRVEGFRLMKDLKTEIRKGAPGGQKFPALSYLARYGFGKRTNRPLAKLALAIRYEIENKPYVVRIGWTGAKVSKSWKRIAAAAQEGFSKTITEKQRRWFRRSLGKEDTRIPKRYQKYFKLKRETTEFKTPARPIISPFWRAHKEQAWRNIRKNFRRKLAGARI